MKKLLLFLTVVVLFVSCDKKEDCSAPITEFSDKYWYVAIGYTGNNSNYYITSLNIFLYDYFGGEEIPPLLGGAVLIGNTSFDVYAIPRGVSVAQFFVSYSTASFQSAEFVNFTRPETNSYNTHVLSFGFTSAPWASYPIFMPIHAIANYNLSNGNLSLRAMLEE